MFVSVIITLIVLNNFLVLINTKNKLPNIHIIKNLNVDINTLNYLIVISKIFFSILIFIFYFYSFIFLPSLRLAVSLSVIAKVIMILLYVIDSSKNLNLIENFYIRAWIIRIYSIILIIIWFPHFLPLLYLVF